MAYGSLEARISALEQIIIIIITGGWPPRGPVGDSFASDSSRIEALYRAVGPHIPKGDPFVVDVPRLSLAEAEEKALHVASEITRLQALHGELSAHLKEHRGKK